MTNVTNDGRKVIARPNPEKIYLILYGRWGVSGGLEGGLKVSSFEPIKHIFVTAWRGDNLSIGEHLYVGISVVRQLELSSKQPSSTSSGAFAGKLLPITEEPFHLYWVTFVTGNKEDYGLFRFGDDNEGSNGMAPMGGVHCSGWLMRVGDATTRQSSSHHQGDLAIGTSTQSEVSSANSTLFVPSLTINQIAVAKAFNGTKNTHKKSELSFIFCSCLLEGVLHKSNGSAYVTEVVVIYIFIKENGVEGQSISILTEPVAVEPVSLGSVWHSKRSCSKHTSYLKGFKSGVKFFGLLDPAKVGHYVSKVFNVGLLGLHLNGTMEGHVIEALDPVMLVESKVPAEILVAGDNSRTLGVRVGNYQEGDGLVIIIQVTRNKILAYSSVLHLMTQGRDILTKWLDILEFEDLGELMSIIQKSREGFTTLMCAESQEIINMGLGTVLWDPGGCFYTVTIFPSFFKIWDPGGGLSSSKVCFSLHHLEDKVILEGGGIDRDPTQEQAP